MNLDKQIAVYMTESQAGNIMESLSRNQGVFSRELFDEAIKNNDQAVFNLGRAAGFTKNLKRPRFPSLADAPFYPTPLETACIYDRGIFAEQIITDGFDINTVNAEGHTAAHTVVIAHGVNVGLNGYRRIDDDLKIEALGFLHEKGAKLVYEHPDGTVYLNGVAETRGEHKVAAAIVEMLGGDPRPAAMRPAGRAAGVTAGAKPV